MKAKKPYVTLQSNNVVRSILVAELLLVGPFVAMQLSDEWDWQLFDFVIVGILLAGFGVGFQLIVTGLNSNSRLVILGIVLATTMILIWIELAVGIFGSPFSGS